MPEAKGKIVSIESKVIKCKNRKGELEDRNKHTIKLENDDKYYGLFGDLPYKKGEDVSFEYTIDKKEYEDTETGEKKEYTFYNIKQPSKTEQAVSKIIEPKFNELIKILSMPHMTVSMEKTIQEQQFEPKKFAVHLKVPLQNIDPKVIKEVVDIVEAEIDARVKSWRSPKKALTEEQEKQAEKAAGKLDEKPENEAEGMDQYYD